MAFVFDPTSNFFVFNIGSILIQLDILNSKKKTNKKNNKNRSPQSLCFINLLWPLKLYISEFQGGGLYWTNSKGLPGLFQTYMYNGMGND